MEKILVREGADRRTVGRFYVAVVQAVILLGSETWILTPQLEKALKGFHQQAAWRMAGMYPNRQWDGTCVDPSIGVALKMVGM